MMKQNSFGLAMLAVALAAAPISGTYAAPTDNGIYRVNMLDYGTKDAPVDRTGIADDSAALARAITVANLHTAVGKPACVYIPAGAYRIVSAPPSFALAGCVKGDGSSQTTLIIDPKFAGDLFAWSEAWVPKTPGPTVVGLKVQGSSAAAELQNAFVFYDRNDEVFMEDITVNNLHGRVLYSGVTKDTPQGFMRESHMISLRFFNDGAPGVPVVEFNSVGPEGTDATNEIRMSMVDIYGAAGPSFVIRNASAGGVRDITLEALRIEGLQQDVFGPSHGDLLTIGDSLMTGSVNNIVLTDVELIDPGQGYCALRMLAPSGHPSPYQITVHGFIGGGQPYGQGLCIDAGRTSAFHFSGIHTAGTNVVIGRGVSQVLLDGGGQERDWSFSVDPTSRGGISFPLVSQPFAQ
jgi:hypothetical protein